MVASVKTARVKQKLGMFREACAAVREGEDGGGYSPN